MCTGRERISGNGFAGIINGRSPIRKFFPKLFSLSVNRYIPEIVEDPLGSGLNTVRFSSQYGYVLLKAKITETLVKPMLFKLHFRSEEHTSELQSRGHLVCRLLLEKKKKQEKGLCCTVVT